MKRIFIPTKKALDWQHLLADPDKHWEPGTSVGIVKQEGFQ